MKGWPWDKPSKTLGLGNPPHRATTKEKQIIIYLYTKKNKKIKTNVWGKK
jgi:hypothetical protein